MPAEIIQCQQGSPEWFEARRGIPTASEFHAVIAKGEGKTRRSYMLKLAGEIITGTVAEGFSNAHMDRGREMEAEARAEYEFMTGRTVESVGFIRHGRAGASPDGLILSSAALIEIKTKLPHALIDVILKDELPPEHRAQCQGALWVAERDHLDFVAYWPGLPLFVKPVFRDETFIATLASEIAKFNEELDAIVTRVREYRMDTSTVPNSAPPARNAGAGKSAPPLPPAPATNEPPSEAFKTAVSAMKVAPSRQALREWWTASRTGLEAVLSSDEWGEIERQAKVIAATLPETDERNAA